MKTLLDVMLDMFHTPIKTIILHIYMEFVVRIYCSYSLFIIYIYIYKIYLLNDI